jgi:lysyl-tRNA synthetase class 2
MLEKVQSDRLAKLEQIRALGIDPYGQRYDTAQPIAEILTKYEQAEKALVAQPFQAVQPEAQSQAGNALGAPKGPVPPRPVPPKPTGLHGDAAGRIVLYRDMGKMIFAQIRDSGATMQIALRKSKDGIATENSLDDKSFQLAKLLDLGDIIAVCGPLERTRTGEVTIWANKLTFLTKSLNPMPEKWHGLSDVETRYRQRYLDLMANPDSMDVFRKRIAIINHFRDVLRAKGFVEVETPMMQSIYGGAAARPFTTHHNALDIDLFMRISPELYLKRLMVGGMEKVFEINRNFRNEGIDTRHNPEFTMMELYQAYADYNTMMDITEELIAGAAALPTQADLWAKSKELHDKPREDPAIVEDVADKLMRGTLSIDDAVTQIVKREEYQESEHEAAVREAPAYLAAFLMRRQGRCAIPYGTGVVDYTRPWRRAGYADLLKEHAGVDWNDEPAVRAKASELKIEEANKDLAVVVNEIFEAVVEPKLREPAAQIDISAPGEPAALRVLVTEPVFVKDYPAAICPLTRRKADDPSVALRFECFIAGMEIANAYTELNDPAVQEANFASQLRGEAKGETMRVMDEDFVTALRHGMPPAGGLGIGIDRVVMLLTNKQSIRDVVLFPLLRPQ